MISYWFKINDKNRYKLQNIIVLYNICSFETLLYKKEQKICKYIFYLSELLKSWEICKLNKTFANPQNCKMCHKSSC